MVRITKSILIILLLYIGVSCSVNKKAIQSNQDEITLIKTKYNKKEMLSFNLWRTLNVYNSIYLRCPRRVDDLIVLIERLGEDYQMINENAYQFLKKNRNNLIFVISPDSVTTIYRGKITEQRIVERAEFASPCNSVDMSLVDFFDEDGLYVSRDSLSSEVVQRLYREYWSYFYATRDNPGDKVLFEKTKFEYTPSSLKDLCGNELLDINRSPLIKNTFNYLDSLARANNFSRIIASGFIDRYCL